MEDIFGAYVFRKRGIEVHRGALLKNNFNLRDRDLEEPCLPNSDLQD